VRAQNFSSDVYCRFQPVWFFCTYSPTTERFWSSSFSSDTVLQTFRFLTALPSSSFAGRCHVMMYVPRGEKPSSKTLAVGSVVMTWPSEASTTETLERVSMSKVSDGSRGLLFG
jgi:hypothetical protein